MPLRIGERPIGGAAPPYVIAEVGVNHNGDVDLAQTLIDAAASSGADAVKFQTFHAESLAVADAPPAAYQRARGAADSQRTMLSALELPDAALPGLRRRALERGVAFLSTPFDIESLHRLVGMGMPAIKIGSGDLTNLPLLRAAASTKRPLVISTGMAHMSEIDGVMSELRGARVVLLHCTSAYPAPPEEANLRAMETMRRRFGVDVGYSDHTLGTTVAVAAVALGAVIVEKHLTLDRSMEGPDHSASLEPAELRSMVTELHQAHAALGTGSKEPRASEADTLRTARRSLVTARALPSGHRLAARDLAAKRPGTGISPMEIDSITGSITKRPLPADWIITSDDIDLGPDGPG